MLQAILISQHFGIKGYFVKIYDIKSFKLYLVCELALQGTKYCCTKSHTCNMNMDKLE